MDIDVALQDLRNAIDNEEWKQAQDIFYSMDEWLCRGGFLPKPWAQVSS